jgi:hypothetical protein
VGDVPGSDGGREYRDEDSNMSPSFHCRLLPAWEIVWHFGRRRRHPLSGRFGKVGLRLEFDSRLAEMYPFGLILTL